MQHKQFATLKINIQFHVYFEFSRPVVYLFIDLEAFHFHVSPQLTSHFLCPQNFVFLL